MERDNARIAPSDILEWLPHFRSDFFYRILPFPELGHLEKCAVWFEIELASRVCQTASGKPAGHRVKRHACHYAIVEWKSVGYNGLCHSNLSCTAVTKARILLNISVSSSTPTKRVCCPESNAFSYTAAPNPAPDDDTEA